MAVEVAFETAGQIEEKLELYEKLLGVRFSMKDKYFATTSQKPET
jgi:hypothetical protein